MFAVEYLALCAGMAVLSWAAAAAYAYAARSRGLQQLVARRSSSSMEMRPLLPINISRQDLEKLGICSSVLAEITTVAVSPRSSSQSTATRRSSSSSSSRATDGGAAADTQHPGALLGQATLAGALKAALQLHVIPGGSGRLLALPGACWCSWRLLALAGATCSAPGGSWGEPWRGRRHWRRCQKRGALPCWCRLERRSRAHTAPASPCTPAGVYTRRILAAATEPLPTALSLNGSVQATCGATGGKGTVTVNVASSALILEAAASAATIIEPDNALCDGAVTVQVLGAACGRCSWACWRSWRSWQGGAAGSCWTPRAGR